jgi:xanthine dehydrogenase YagS FAD-binding subunit
MCAAGTTDAVLPATVLAAICVTPTRQKRRTVNMLFLNASRCVAVTPSDTAPALVALEAQMVISREGGQRIVSAENFFVGPAVDIEKTTVLRAGEILTAVRIPAKWAGADYYYEKVADRNVWDFALASVAAVMRIEGGNIADSRLVAGAVECTPRRLTSVERAVRGRPRNADTARAVAGMAVQGAKPLTRNGYKIPMMDHLVQRVFTA